MVVASFTCSMPRIPHASGDEPESPTCAAMSGNGIPHASGDEPYKYSKRRPDPTVYPTRVGMNRTRRKLKCLTMCIPHASGDEPLPEPIPAKGRRIPHASGDEPEVRT